MGAPPVGGAQSVLGACAMFCAFDLGLWLN